MNRERYVVKRKSIPTGDDLPIPAVGEILICFQDGIQYALIEGSNPIVIDINTTTPTTGQTLVFDTSNVLIPGSITSATGSVTTHSDVTSAGSGQIITAAERAALPRIVSAAIVGTNLVFTRDDATFFNVDVTNLINVAETVTTFADNLDGTVTYTSEDSTVTTTVKRIIEIHGTGTRLLGNATYTLNNLGTTVINLGSSFTVAGGVITYTGTPTVSSKVYFRASASQLTNGTRSTSKHAIFLNGVLLTRTESYAYHRVNGDGNASTSYTGTISLNTGDTIELRSAEGNNADVVTQLMEQTNLIIEI